MPEPRRKEEIESLDALLAKDGLLPGFRIPGKLEDAFAAQEAAYRRQAILTGMWLGLFLYPAFIVTDMLLIPDMLEMAMIVRFVIAIPLILLSIWLVASRRVRGVAMELLPIGLVCLGATLTCATIVMSSARLGNMSFSYNNIMLVFLAVVFQPRLRYCTLGCALVIGTTALFAWMSPRFEIGYWAFYVASAGVTAIACCYASWTFNNQRRQRFLSSRRDALRLEELMEQNRFLEQLSVLDPLTGLGNRRAFERALETAVRKAVERGGTVAVAMIDIDFFKRFNDHYGHPAGDECLRRVAAALGGADEGRNFTARLGGEEFAVILAEVDRRILALLGERLRSAVSMLDIPHAALGEGGRVTVSLGVGHALFGLSAPPVAAGLIVDAADAALYRAKRTGRDRVVVAPAIAADTALSA